MVFTLIPATAIDSEAILLQAWTGPEIFRRLRVPDFNTIGAFTSQHIYTQAMTGYWYEDTEGYVLLVLFSILRRVLVECSFSLFHLLSSISNSAHMFKTLQPEVLGRMAHFTYLAWMLLFVSAVPGTALRAGSGFRKPEQRSESQQLSHAANATDASDRTCCCIERNQRNPPRFVQLIQWDATYKQVMTFDRI